MSTSSAFDLPPLPSSLLRLTTSLHQYSPGAICSSSSLSFTASFSSCGAHHPKTAALLTALDRSRLDLSKALQLGDNVSTAAACERYLPLIRRLLLSCEVQPTTAVLDAPLSFSWQGGLEGDGGGGVIGKVRESEAIMYEVTMVMGTLAVANAGSGCDHSLAGDYSAACSSFKSAASVLYHLHSSHIPSWTALGKTGGEEEMPAECVGAVCEGFQGIFLGHAQQMAVAKAMEGPLEKVNMSLLSKLTKGTESSFSTLASHLRSTAPIHFCRLPPQYLSYVAFQEALQRALSVYFQARFEWSEGKER